MERTFTFCDKCGSPHATAFFALVDRVPDGAGSMEDVQERADLCPECQAAFIRKGLRAYSFAEAEAWVKDNRLSKGKQPRVEDILREAQRRGETAK